MLSQVNNGAHMLPIHNKEHMHRGVDFNLCIGYLLVETEGIAVLEIPLARI